MWETLSIIPTTWLFLIAAFFVIVRWQSIAPGEERRILALLLGALGLGCAVIVGAIASMGAQGLD